MNVLTRKTFLEPLLDEQHRLFKHYGAVNAKGEICDYEHDKNLSTGRKLTQKDRDSHNVGSMTVYERYKTGVCWDWCIMDQFLSEKLGFPYEGSYLLVEAMPNFPGRTHTFSVFKMGSTLYCPDYRIGRKGQILSSSSLRDLAKAYIQPGHKYELHKFDPSQIAGMNNQQALDTMLDHGSGRNWVLDVR
jgi:hypothetical protein